MTPHPTPISLDHAQLPRRRLAQWLTEHVETLFKLIVSGGALLSFYPLSQYSYILFHSLVEIFSIIIGWTLFVLVWNSRRWARRPYLLMLGAAFGFASGIDLLHLFAYKGLNIFPGYDANLPTQLWIAARYLQSVSMLLAPRWLPLKPPRAARGGDDQPMERRLADYGLILAYALVTTLLLGAIFLRVFPTCYIEGQGLTPFKIVSEYVISFMLLVSLGLLWRKRANFDRRLLSMLMGMTVATILSELAFTFYVGVYDLSNLVGHYCKLAAFYLLYLAVIEASLQRPYEALFKNLSQRVRLYRQMFLEHSAVKMLLDPESGAITQVNHAAAQFYGYPVEVLQTMRIDQVNTRPREEILSAMQQARQRQCNHFFFQHRLASGDLREVEVYSSPIQTEEGVFLYSLIHDITARQQAEEALRESEARYRRLAQENAQLLTEVNHRVGNNLAMLAALVEWEMDGKATPETREALVKLQNQVQNMARVHQLLSSAQWSPMDLGILASEVIRHILSASPKHIEFQLHCPEELIYVSAKQAFKLALMFNELTINSLKYAFPRRERGLIWVELATDGKEARLVFGDDGGGWPAETLARQNWDTGLALIQAIVEVDLRGKMSLRNAGGAVLECTFALDAAAQAR